jgi:hypothetical protein
MKQVPKDAIRLTAEHIQSGFIPLDIAKQYAWTTIPGTAAVRTQTEEGMGKGQPITEVTFLCGRCEDTLTFHSATEHGEHYVRCSCDATLVQRVTY